MIQALLFAWIMMETRCLKYAAARGSSDDSFSLFPSILKNLFVEGPAAPWASSATGWNT